MLQKLLKHKFLRLISKTAEKKKLYFAISILAVFNLINFSELVYTKHKLKLKNTIYVKDSVLEDKLKTKTKNTFSEAELKQTINNYCTKLFQTDKDSYSWLSEHTEKDFFESELKILIENRDKKNIKSKFKILRIYLERLEQSYIKAIVIGTEDFTNNKFIDRNLVIEILFDTKSKLIKQILSIKDFKD